MVSDGNQFRIYVPPKNKFILGRNDQEIKGRKDVPINLRPQHIFQALIIDPVSTIRTGNTRVLEEEQEGKHKYYVLSIIGPAKEGVGSLRRKIWVDRFDLRMVRQKFYERGRIVSDINYREFKDFEGGDYPSVIDFTRPQEDYSLRIRISKAVTNETLRDEQLAWSSQDGTELVDLTQNPTNKMSQSLVVANLFARPMRTLATVLAIGMEVVLILLVVGLTRGMVNENAKRLEGIGADIVLQPPGSSFMLASSTAAMSEKLVELLAVIQGVSAVSPVMVQLNTQGGIGLIYGIEPESFNRVTRGFTFLQGRAFQDPYEVIVDDIHAKSKKLQVGQSTKFLNHNFRVSGIFEHGKGSRVFLPLRTVQDLTGTPGKVSLMFIKCESQKRSRQS